MFPWNELLEFDTKDPKSKEQINEISVKVTTEALGDIVDDAGDAPMDAPDENTPEEESNTDDDWDETSTDEPEESDDAGTEEPPDDGSGEEEPINDAEGKPDNDGTEEPTEEPATEPSNIEAFHPYREANSRELLSKKLLDLLGEIRISISSISTKSEFESKTVVVNKLRELEDIVQKNHEIVNKTPKEDSMLRYAMAVKTYKQIIEEI